MWYRQDAQRQPRDNVLVEYGLLAGVLGRERVVICRYGEPRIASDLQGFVYIDGSKPHRAEAEIAAWAKTLRPRKAEELRDYARLLERYGRHVLWWTTERAISPNATGAGR